MSAVEGTRQQRVIARTLCGAAILLAFVMALYRVRTFDTFFHLATGRWILEQGHLPDTDPFSFTFHGAAWQNHSWGFQVALAKLNAMGGFAAVSLLQAALSGALAGTSLWAARRPLALLPWSALLVVLPPAAFREVLEARPHLFAFVCLNLSLLVVLRVHAGARPHRLAWLVPLYLAWATAHGSHLLLPVLLLLASLACVLERRHRLALAFVAALLTVLCCGLWVAPAAFSQGGEHVASSFLESSVREWAPVTSEVLLTRFQGRAFLVIGFLSIVGSVSRADDSPQLANVARGVLPGLLLGVLLLLGFTSLRMLALFSLGAGALWLPLAARTLARLWSQNAPPSWASSSACYALSVFGMLALATPVLSDQDTFRVGLGLMHERFPEQAVADMRKRQRIRRLYNAYNFGGYLIWEHFPEAGVFVDGRAITVYPPRFLETFDAAYVDRRAFEALASQYAIDGVLMPATSPRTRGLLQYLASHPSYERVYADEIAVVFERRAP